MPCLSQVTSLASFRKAAIYAYLNYQYALQGHEGNEQSGIADMECCKKVKDVSCDCDPEVIVEL